MEREASVLEGGAKIQNSPVQGDDSGQGTVFWLGSDPLLHLDQACLETSSLIVCLPSYSEMTSRKGTETTPPLESDENTLEESFARAVVISLYLGHQVRILSWELSDTYQADYKDFWNSSSTVQTHRVG